MYLIRNKTHNNNNIKTPLIFETKDYKDKKIINLTDIMYNSSYIYTYFKTLIDDILSRENKNVIWEGRNYKLYFSYGFIIYRIKYRTISYNFVTIVYRNKKTREIEAWVNQDYIKDIVSHKSMINKFIKNYGVKHRKNIHYVPQKDFDAFIGKIIMSIDDYTNENQLKITKNFLTYIKNERK